MFVRTDILDAGGDARDLVRGHLGALFSEPVNEVLAMHEDDVFARDLPRLEAVPEDDNRLDPSNVGLLGDVLS